MEEVTGAIGTRRFTILRPYNVNREHYQEHLKEHSMENKYRISFTVGLGKTKDGKKIEERDMKLTCARKRLARSYSGYTEIRHSGGWNDGGVLVEEPGVTWQVITEQDKGYIGTIPPPNTLRISSSSPASWW